MTPQHKLKDIITKYNDFIINPDDHEWLISRVEQLEAAIKKVPKELTIGIILHEALETMT